MAFQTSCEYASARIRALGPSAAFGRLIVYSSAYNLGRDMEPLVYEFGDAYQGHVSSRITRHSHHRGVSWNCRRLPWLSFGLRVPWAVGFPRGGRGAGDEQESAASLYLLDSVMDLIIALEVESEMGARRPTRKY